MKFSDILSAAKHGEFGRYPYVTLYEPTTDIRSGNYEEEISSFDNSNGGIY